MNTRARTTMEEAQQNKKMKTRARTTTMEDLNEEIINEILVRLPLKKAAQCRSLNKTFLSRISHPNFVRRHAAVASSSPPLTVFNHRTIFTAIDPQTNSSTFSTSAGVSIQAVCNGLLLVHYFTGFCCRHCVFNPITGGIIPVLEDALVSHDGVGLAAPVDSHHFKLVALCAAAKGDENSDLRFVVVVPVGDSAVVKSLVNIACGGGFRRAEDYGQPSVVYSHGALHWMGERGEAMVAFDVDKEEARIVDGPLKNTNIPPGVGIWSGVNTWFGSARGSLTFMYNLQREIVISSHDRQSREWRIQYKIANMGNPYENALAVFFDGERMFVKLHDQIYMNDLLRGRQWKKMDDLPVEERSPYGFTAFVHTLAKVSGHFFTAFVPTFAKVSDQDCTLDQVLGNRHSNLDLIWVGEEFKTLQDFFRKCCT